MNIPNIILQVLDKKGEVKSSDIVKITGFSRVYVNRFFKELRDEGKIILIGKANQARYIPATEQAFNRAKGQINSFHQVLQNENLFEDIILAQIKKRTGIFTNIQENVSRILDYAFTEMLNNAIEHSQSDKIEVNMTKGTGVIYFDVRDKGIGIFNNIMQKKHLRTVMEAIQSLHKGKLSTAPEAHSGEGIFFTSKVADKFTIRSSTKEMVFDNFIEDLFISDVKDTIGTKVTFSISCDSKKNTSDVFQRYTDDFEFSKTKVRVKLYKIGLEYISRSQARRILAGLDQFKTIELDFKDIKTIGQGFADEIFAIWKSRYPEVVIIPENINENISFMINRASSRVKDSIICK